LDSSHNMTSHPDYQNKWFILASLGMGVFLATIDASIVNVALPTLVETLQTEFAVVQWVPLAYMLTIASLILIMGRLGDLKGKKKIYTSGMIIFTVGSVFCGVSPTIYWLISARIFQGLGASMMAALGAALITEAFPDNERGKALGTIGGIVSIGIVTGPALGGILIDALSWHWIFFVNVPVGIAGIIMVITYLPNSKHRGKQSFDHIGAIILFISLLSFLVPLTVGQKIGFKSLITLSLIGLWLLSFGLFIFWELRTADPLIDLHVFRNYLFSINLLLGFLSFFTTAGVVLLMPFFLENILGYTPHQVGLLLIAIPVSAGVISPISGILSDRLGTRPITVVGLLFLLGGYMSLTMLSQETSALEYILRFLPIGLGLGIFQSPNNSAIMGAAPPEHLGIVSGLLSITRTMGQTAGIAVLGAFWASRVSAYAGSEFDAGPTKTHLPAQVSGLHDTIVAIVYVVAAALLISIFSVMLEKKRRIKAEPGVSGRTGSS
jgi:EmrB/QacA subfamily drug resistance transporter